MLKLHVSLSTYYAMSVNYRTVKLAEIQTITVGTLGNTEGLVHESLQFLYNLYSH